MYGRCIDHMGRKSACKTRGHETPWTHIGSADVRIQFGRNGQGAIITDVTDES